MIYVGIDVASDKHDFNLMSDNIKLKKHSITIPNSISGFNSLRQTINDFCSLNNDFNVRVGLESTGCYHLNLLAFLLSNDYNTTLINPRLTNSYKEFKQLHNAKTDNLDSANICMYLYDNKESFKPYTLKSFYTESLKTLSRERFNISYEIRQVKVDIHRKLSQLFPEFLKLFPNIYSESALQLLSKYPSPKKLANAHLDSIQNILHGKCKSSAMDVINTAKSSIGIDNEFLSFSLSQSLKSLSFIQSQLDQYDIMIKKYVDLTFPNILSIPGVGYTTAGLIIGEIGDVSRFQNAEHLLSFAGLDIEVYESGKFKATRHAISKKGSVYLRYALWQVAKTCWRFDPMFNALYLKKKSENKHFFVILGHLQKKLTKVIYSILKSGNNYIPA